MLIRRLPEGRPVAMARSECEGCGHRLGPGELVPLLSYLALRGRCRFCRRPIDAFHPAVELAACGVALWALLADRSHAAADLWVNCALGWGLLALAWIDWRTGRLPDVLTLPLLLAGLTATFLLDSSRLLDHALGAVAGYAALRVLAMAYEALRGRRGMGEGDAKLLAACGAWVGWDGLPTVVWVAALTGIGLALAMTAVTRASLTGTLSLPFGPCLALGAWVVRLHPMLLGG